MNMENFKVLIVEADSEVAQLLKANIELEYSCSVDIALSTLEAHALTQKNKYDLISIEQHLPANAGTIKGNQFIAQMRSSCPLNRDVPILFFTVYSQEIFKEHLQVKSDIYVLDKTATMDKYLTWVKILLYSQRKREKNKPAENTSYEEVIRTINFARHA